VNRLLMPYLNEAIVSLQEGAASLKQIDQDLTAFGMPVGPFTLLDTLGLDICGEVARILHKSYGPRMAPAPLLEAMVKAGRLGVKTSRGFYEYNLSQPREPEQTVEQLIQAIWQETGPQRTRWTQARPLLAMVNEAVLTLQEGIASARDIDLAMVAGTGFPQDKEGPLHYADRIGIEQVLHELEEFSQTLGTRFWPAPLLRRMVDAGFTGRDAGRGFFMY